MTEVPSPLRRRILLAEDNPVNRQIVTELLEKRGHEVKLAGNGIGVLDALEGGPFDCILMDVQMPEMDGLQTASAIRVWEIERGGHIPIIALTGLATRGDRRRCLDAGMDGYLSKPIRAKELFDAIEHENTKEKFL
jgi:CheY-like chemotaxis protein